MKIPMPVMQPLIIMKYFHLRILRNNLFVLKAILERCCRILDEGEEEMFTKISSGKNYMNGLIFSSFCVKLQTGTIYFRNSLMKTRLRRQPDI